MVETLEQEFERVYRRKLGEPVSQVVHDEGNLDCRHNKIVYWNVALQGQAWWCDVSNCDRHEGMDYSPGTTMRFPPNSLVAMPNPEYGGTDEKGGERFYSHETGGQGIIRLLDKKDWAKRERTS